VANHFALGGASFIKVLESNENRFRSSSIASGLEPGGVARRSLGDPKMASDCLGHEDLG